MKAGCGASRSDASASVELSQAGPDLPHSRQWALFFVPSIVSNTSTEQVACPQSPRPLEGNDMLWGGSGGDVL